MKKPYVTPELRDIGSLEKLTQAFNKVGKSTDQFSTVVPGLVGSIVNI